MEAGPGAGGWGVTRARERLTLSYLQPRERRQQVTSTVVWGQSDLFKYSTLSELLCFTREREILLPTSSPTVAKRLLWYNCAPPPPLNSECFQCPRNIVEDERVLRTFYHTSSMANQTNELELACKA